MKTLKLSYILLFVLMCVPFSVAAENYDVFVTRKGSNLYKVDSSDVIIQTRYCYVIAYSGKALLRSTGYGGEFVFADSRDTCSVKAVYGRSKSFHGNFDVQVNREADDWYGIVGNDNYIKTSLCLNPARNQSATVTLHGDGWGTLRFEDGGGCTVEGIYSQLQL
jgi:hypothetical protein